jgi:hypothetical protein
VPAQQVDKQIIALAERITGKELQIEIDVQHDSVASCGAVQGLLALSFRPLGQIILAKTRAAMAG